MDQGSGQADLRHPQATLRGFPNDGKSLGQEVIQGLAGGQSIPECFGPRAELFVTVRVDFAFQRKSYPSSTQRRPMLSTSGVESNTYGSTHARSGPI